MGSDADVAPLAGFRILDVADDAGVFAGRLLADLGADVVRLEAPGADRVRSMAPFLGTVPGTEHSFQHLAYNAGKRSVVVDPSDPGSRATVLRLVASADALLDTAVADALPFGLTDAEIRGTNPRLVRASITPFGRSSPWAARKGSDLVAAAAGGLLHVSGDPGMPPVLAGGNQSYKLASMAACTGLLAALRQRSAGDGRGLHVDISVQECVNFATLQTASPSHWRWWRHVPPRRTGYEFPVVRCRDGKYAVARARPDRWDELREWALTHGLAVRAGRGEWQEATQSAVGSFRLGEAADLIETLAGMYDRAEFLARCYAIGIVSLPLQTFAEMKVSDQLEAIGEFVVVPHELHGVELELPKSPFAGIRGTPAIRRAPLLGEDTGDVIASLPPVHPTRADAGRRYDGTSLPLNGLRVMELGLVLAGPLTGRILANLGAEVIKVESAARMDIRGAVPPPAGPTLTAGGWFNDANTGKLSATVNTSSAEGKALLFRLAARCDVIVNNLRPGAVERMGLPYGALRAANPGAVVVHMSGPGRAGPWAGLATFGNQINAAGGLNSVTGFPGTPPTGLGVAFADFVSPYLAASAAIAAVIQRERTGVGQEIDMSQLPGLISLLGAEWMQYAATGEQPPRRANRDPNFAPHGAYPTAAADRWVALAVAGDEEWRRVAAAIGNPGLANDARFVSHALRKANEDELDRIISAWTKGQDRWAAADMLQAHGIAAAAVEDLSEILDRDPCLGPRFEVVEQPSDPGLPITVHGEQIRFTGLANPVRRAPAMGEHNDYVLREVLGLGEDEVAALVEAGVIG